MNFDLHCSHKEDTPPEIYRSRFHELCSQHDGFHRLYTDGSKIGDQVASAAIARNRSKTVRLPDKASISRAELYAITLAMDFIRHSKDTKFIVFSDSMSSLEALNGFKIEVDLVLKIIRLLKPHEGWQSNRIVLDSQSREHTRQRESRHCS